MTPPSTSTAHTWAVTGAGAQWHLQATGAWRGRDARTCTTPRTQNTSTRRCPITADVGVTEMMKSTQEAYPERRKMLMELLGINPKWRMHQLSDGQRRRVQIFLQLLRPSDVLLLDEITTDLDVITRQDFLQFLKVRHTTLGAREFRARSTATHAAPRTHVPSHGTGRDHQEWHNHRVRHAHLRWPGRLGHSYRVPGATAAEVIRHV